MKLKDDFFTILTASLNGDKVEYLVRLNGAHEIYSYHFPGNPITPGVCLIRIVNELLSEKTGSNFILREASKIRYLKVINPTKTELVNFCIDIDFQANYCSVSAKVSADDEIFAKFSLMFESVEKG